MDTVPNQSAAPALFELALLGQSCQQDLACFEMPFIGCLLSFHHAVHLWAIDQAIGMAVGVGCMNEYVVHMDPEPPLLTHGHAP